MRLLLAAILAAVVVGNATAADTLGRIKSNGVIRLGYFVGSAPFSSVGADKTPQGYSVELCDRIAKGVQRQLGLAQLKIEWVELSTTDRIKAVSEGRVDIECGTSTWSFTRQQMADFSLMTFVDGASLLTVEEAGIRRVSDAGGKKIAVIRGTTTERALNAALAKDKVTAIITLVDTRDQGYALLTEGKVDAFASDRFLLMNGMNALKSAKPLRLMDEDFSVEPYALALPRNDDNFRLAVNRALADVFRSGDIMKVYENWLGRFGRPSLLLSALYYLQQIPE